jgi:hypothetical protein
MLETDGGMPLPDQGKAEVTRYWWISHFMKAQDMSA